METIDYTLLIQTVPEVSKKDGSVYTCTVGYSPQKGWIRVYPMPYNKGLKRWNTYRINVEKNKQDSRAESWKLSSYSRHEQWKNFNQDVELVGSIREADRKYMKALMLNNTMQAISQLNKDRRSIGFLYVQKAHAYWDVNENYVNPHQLLLFQDIQEDYDPYTKQDKQFHSRIKFMDQDGTHNLMLNNWQYYMAQINFGHKPEAFRYINNDPQILMLGNMFSYRNTWIVLESFRQPNNPLTL